MASEYVKLHIMKHALQHYINRDGASEKDVRQENGYCLRLQKNWNSSKSVSIQVVQEVVE